MWGSLFEAASAHWANVAPIAQAAADASHSHISAALAAGNLAIAGSLASGLPTSTALVAGSLTSYIVGKVARSSSALASVLNIDGALHVTEFAARVRACELKDTVRITSMAMMESTSAEEFIVQKTNATMGHRFVVATIEVKDEASAKSVRTFARVDFWGRDAFQEHPVSQVVMLSDDLDVLQHEARELGRISALPEPEKHANGGPTLGSFASLLDLLHSRTPDYNVLVRNCYWHSETIFLCVTRAYSADWLAGSVTPPVLVRWIRGECDSVACIIDMAFAGGALENFTAVASTAAGLYRWGLANFAPGDARIAVPEEDIRQILEIWNPAGKQ